MRTLCISVAIDMRGIGSGLGLLESFSFLTHTLPLSFLMLDRSLLISHLHVLHWKRIRRQSWKTSQGTLVVQLPSFFQQEDRFPGVSSSWDGKMFMGEFVPFLFCSHSGRNSSMFLSLSVGMNMCLCVPNLYGFFFFLFSLFFRLRTW